LLSAQLIVQRREIMEKSRKTAGILASALAITSMFGLSAFADSRHQNESSRDRDDRGRYERDSRNDDRGRYERDSRNDDRGRYERDSRNDDRGRYERDSRNDDRDFVSGVVESVNRRRGVVLIRERHGRRSIAVEMIGRRGNRSGIDLGDLRRGDSVTFAGQWSRGGVFEAWRIDDVDTRGGRRR
jgi:hypothetical protein